MLLTYWQSNVGYFNLATTIHAYYSLKWLYLVALWSSGLNFVGKVHSWGSVVHSKVCNYTTSDKRANVVLRVEVKLHGWVQSNPLLKVTWLHHFTINLFH